MGVADELGDDADMAGPAGLGAIDNDVDMEVEAAAPLMQFILEQQVVGGSRAIEDGDVTIGGAVRQYGVNCPVGGGARPRPPATKTMSSPSAS